MATIPAGFQVIYNHRSHALPIPEPQDPILIVQQERFVGILDELVEAQHSLKTTNSNDLNCNSNSGPMPTQ